MREGTTELPSKRHDRAAGLTLTELLIVLSILGALATAVVPSAQVLMNKAHNDDVAARLSDSWRLALAHAQSRQQPVVLKFNSSDKGLRISIRDDQDGELWSTRLPVSQFQMKSVGAQEGRSNGEMLIYPHGLAEPLVLSWKSETGDHSLTLPLDLPLPSPTVTTLAE